MVRREGVGLGDARDALLVLGLVGLANMLLLWLGSVSSKSEKSRLLFCRRLIHRPPAAAFFLALAFAARAFDGVAPHARQQSQSLHVAQW